MAGVTRVSFSQGDSILEPRFRENLNVVAMQAADGASWTWGPGLVGSYSPGSGFTLALDSAVLPTVQRSSFVARINLSSAKAHGWTELTRSGADTWADKEGGRGGTESEQSAYEINGRENVPQGLRVVMWEVMDTSATTRYEFDLSSGLEDDSAVTLGTSGAGEEAALSDLWDRRGGVSAKVWVMTRVYSTKVGPIYGYKRLLELDTNGQVYRVGAESRYEIDATDICDVEE